jgi:ribonucleoside-diphosphate reductase alpha chain
MPDPTTEQRTPTQDYMNTRAFPNQYASINPYDGQDTGVRFNITLNHTRDDLMTDFGRATVKDRYLLPGEDIQGMFGRVACWFAKDADHAQRLYDAMSQHWFMPATPVLSNGGTNRGNPISCFLNSVPDSLEGISATWNENVWLAAKGGGIGTNWSNVREMGAGINDLGKTSGIIPFIKVMDAQTSAISQGSLRRGSAAVYLDVDHPEIEEFIDIRRPTGDANRRSLNIHHGVNITDAFMEAVIAGKDFDLISRKEPGKVVKTVPARDLFIKMLTARVETGEPYMVFIDTVNRKLPQVYKALGLKVSQSNLCSEIALHTGPDYLGKDRTAVCCLASLNMEHSDAWFGNRQFVKDVLYFLDGVMDDFIRRTEGQKGFENARYSAFMERSVGLGYMGFHSMLQAKNIPYESPMAEGQNRRITGWVKATGDEINQKDAVNELGMNPDSREVLDSYERREHDFQPVRWSNWSSIAPTASISIIAGTTSPGVDPIPANVYAQKTLSGTFKVKNRHLEALLREKAAELYERREGADEWLEGVWSSITNHGGSVQHLTFLTEAEKEVFKTGFELDQRWVIEHAAARAPNVCQMASNNIYLRADVNKADLLKLHVSAWRKGVPSLYYCRSLSLQRAETVSHVAGEMPQAASAHDIALKDRGELIVDLSNPEICASCQ